MATNFSNDSPSSIITSTGDIFVNPLHSFNFEKVSYFMSLESVASALGVQGVHCTPREQTPIPVQQSLLVAIRLWFLFHRLMLSLLASVDGKKLR